MRFYDCQAPPPLSFDDEDKVTDAIYDTLDKTCEIYREHIETLQSHLTDNEFKKLGTFLPVLATDTFKAYPKSEKMPLDEFIQKNAAQLITDASRTSGLDSVLEAFANNKGSKPSLRLLKTILSPSARKQRC